MDMRVFAVSLWAEDVSTVTHFYRDVIGLALVTHHTGDHPHFYVGGTYLTILCGRSSLPLNPEPPPGAS